MAGLDVHVTSPSHLHIARSRLLSPSEPDTGNLANGRAGVLPVEQLGNIPEEVCKSSGLGEPRLCSCTCFSWRNGDRREAEETKPICP